MKRNTVILARVVGVVAILGSFAIFAVTDVGVYSLVVTVTGIVTMLAPEAVDSLPWGPTK